MPRPHTPNTVAATAASVTSRTRAKYNRWAAEMRAAGFLVVAPEILPTGRHTLIYTKTDAGIVHELPGD